MHICQIVASWGNGGLEKHVIELSNALSLEHKVTVIVHPVIQHSFAPTVNVVTVDFTQPRWSPRLYWQLLKIINTLKPDVIHAQANKAALLIGRLRSWVKFKVGYVATLHNLKGSVGMFDSFDRVIVVSSRLASLIKKAPTSVVYNGIRLPQVSGNDRAFLAEQYGLDVQKPIWLAVGRLVEAKGFDFLIEAADIADVQVVIVGDGPLQHDLEQQLKQSKAKVVFSGYYQDSYQLLAAADGLVISSRNEGGPYTLPEALLYHVPVISTDVGMVSEFLPSEYIVPVGDVKALAEKLRWADLNISELKEAMAPVWESAQSQLTLNAMVKNTVAVYSEVLKS